MERKGKWRGGNGKKGGKRDRKEKYGHWEERKVRWIDRWIGGKKK